MSRNLFFVVFSVLLITIIVTTTSCQNNSATQSSSATTSPPISNQTAVLHTPASTSSQMTIAPSTSMTVTPSKESPAFSCQPSSTQSPAYKFLVQSNGLVDSTITNHFTTVYKNALAAMVFIHQGQLDCAKRIFDFFQNYYREHKTDCEYGFKKDWYTDKNEPSNADNNYYWEGDNAFLLLALNYYNDTKGNATEYYDLTNALKVSLTTIGNDIQLWHNDENKRLDDLKAEGLANMYAALSPYKGEGQVSEALKKIKYGFFEDYSPYRVLDHINRAALVFGYTRDFTFNSLTVNFEISEQWLKDAKVTVTAYSGDAMDNNQRFINIEICEQILNAWGLWQSKLDFSLPDLQSELDKTLITDKNGSTGLPYSVSTESEIHFGFPSASYPIIDSNCYELFAEWKFNPFTHNDRKSVEQMRDTDYLYAVQCKESHNVQVNIRDTLASSDISDIKDGSWLEYKQLDFSPADLNEFTVCLSKDNDSRGVIEIRLDSITGSVIGILKPRPTQGWSNWEDQTTELTSIPSGTHKLFLTFTGSTGICNIKWFKFS